MTVDLNAEIQQLSTDLHNTLTQAQQALKALETAAQTVNAQAGRIGALIDGLAADEQGILATVTDADGLIKSIKIPGWFKK
jgi:ABC-type transporter Mla subunit MlaD